jgi:hypothetical protein
VSIKLTNAALDEAPGGDIILRGVVTPESLHHLQVAPYQREILPASNINELVKAFLNGAAIPDIELGMRGSRTIDRDGAYFLQDDVFIIDGLQRVTAAIQVIQLAGMPHLGATVHFNTTEEWERERFRVLNNRRTKLSSNILLRNQRYDLPVVDMMYKLTNDRHFAMYDRICWDQRLKTQHLISAMTYARAIGVLLSHMGPTRYTRYDELTRGLQTVMNSIGRTTMRDNIKTFFELIDECYGIKRIAFKKSAVYIRQGFLLALAEVLMNHLDFWEGNKLVIDKQTKRKLAQFPVTDPQVSQLAGATGKSTEMLKIMIANHINSGRRTRRLTERIAMPALEDVTDHPEDFEEDCETEEADD